MAKRTGEDRIWTLANFITMTRLIGAVVVFFLLVFYPWTWALWVFCGVAATDKLDGLAARWLKQQTRLGRRLDPTVDYVLLGAVTLGVLATGPWWFLLVMALVALRSSVIAILATGRSRRHQTDMDVNEDGKKAMFCACVAIAAFMFYHTGADRLFLGVGLSFIIAWGYYGLQSWTQYYRASRV